MLVFSAFIFVFHVASSFVQWGLVGMLDIVNGLDLLLHAWLAFTLRRHLVLLLL